MFLLSSNVGEIGLMAGAVAARAAAAADGRADPLRESGDRRAAGARAGGGSARSRTSCDARRAIRARASSTRRSCALMLAGGAWSAFVNVGCSPGRCTRAVRWPGDDDDVRLAGADPVLQGVQLSLGPPLSAAAAVRQPLAERCRRLGDHAAHVDHLPAGPAGTVQHVRADVDRLDHRAVRVSATVLPVLDIAKAVLRRSQEPLG